MKKIRNCRDFKTKKMISILLSTSLVLSNISSVYSENIMDIENDILTVNEQELVNKVVEHNEEVTDIEVEKVDNDSDIEELDKELTSDNLEELEILLDENISIIEEPNLEVVEEIIELSELENLLENAKSFIEDTSFTVSSREQLNNVIEAVETTDFLLQTEVNKEIENLRFAILGLEKVSVRAYRQATGSVILEENYSVLNTVPSWVVGNTGTIEDGMLVLKDGGGDSNPNYSTIYTAGNGTELRNFTLETEYGLKSSTGGKYSVFYLKFSNGVYRQLVFRGTSGVIDRYGFLASNPSGPIYSGNSGLISSSLTSQAGDTVNLSLEISEAKGTSIGAKLTVDGTEVDAAKLSNLPDILNVGEDVYLEEIGIWHSGNVVPKIGFLRITDNDGSTDMPDEVTNVTVENGEFGNVIVNWNESNNARSYTVIAKSEDEEIEYSSKTNSIEISEGLLNGSTYTFTVKAKNPGGETLGVTSSEFTLDSLLGVSEIEASKNLEEKIALTWKDISNEIGYNIYRDGTFITTIDKDSTSFEEEIEEGSYSYKVVPFNNAGETKVTSNVVIGEALANTNPPTTPVNLTGAAGDKKVTLMWEKSERASAYEVFVNGEFFESVITNEIVISELENGKAYTFKVRGINDVGSSDYSNEVTVTPKAPLLEAEYGVWFESAYIKYNITEGIDGYNIYYRENGTGNFTKVDKELVRDERADILGLKGNTTYEIKIAAVIDGVESETLYTTELVQPLKFDRAGFAFSNASPYKSTNGGYNDDGTVKENAVIVYITNENKDTVTGTINGTTFTGLGEILRDGKTALNGEKTISNSTPLIIRIIGEIEKPINGLTSVDGFDVKESGNITIEGVGEGAAVTGFGFIINKSENIVIRNLTFSEFTEDAVEVKGSTNIWVNHNKYLPGKNMGGDKSSGDGSSDVKQGSSFITISYNHYEKSGKAALVGQSDSGEFFVTFYQNYLDNSNSRHPRVRWGSVHVYNNYYSNVKTYGAAAALNANLLVEGNYFENTVRPMIIGSQGHDLKEFSNTNIITSGDSILSSEKNGALMQRNNYMDEYSASWFNEDYDSGASRTTGREFNNFHLNSNMYDFEAVSPELAKERAIAYAGPSKEIVSDNTVPTKVTEVNVSFNDELNFELSWAGKINATGYVIEMKENNGDFTKIATVENNKYTTTEVAKVGNTYTFRIYAYNSNGNGAYSNEISIEYKAPATITNLVVTTDVNEISATWDSVENAIEYVVSLIKDDEVVETLKVTGTSVNFTGIPVGNYKISVVCRNGDLDSDAVESQLVEVLGLKLIDQLLAINTAFDAEISSKLVTDEVLGFSILPNPQTSENYVNYIEDKGVTKLKLTDKEINVATQVGTSITKILDEPVDEIVVVETTFNFDKSTTGSSLRPLVLKSSNNKIILDSQIGAGVTEGIYRENPANGVLVDLKVVLDFENKVMDFYWNGELTSNNVPFKDIEANDLGSISGVTPNNNSSTQAHELSIVYSSIVVKTSKVLEDTVVEIDTKVLDNLITKSKVLSEDSLYTPETRDILKSVLTELENTVFNTQEDVLLAIEMLQKAIDGLKEINDIEVIIDTEALKSLIGKAKLLLENSLYTSETKELLRSVIIVLENTVFTTQEDVLLAIEQLQKAIDGLKEVNNVVIDRTELDRLLNQAKNLSQNKEYTLASRDSLKDIISKTENKTYNTNEDILVSVNELEAGIKALVKYADIDYGDSSDDYEYSSNKSNNISSNKDNSTVIDIEPEKVPLGTLEEHLPYIKGYGDGSFRANAKITRAEAIAIIYNIFGNETDVDLSVLSKFSDVKNSDWYSNAVAYGVQEGIINGYSDSTFRPNVEVTRAELATMLYKYSTKEGNNEVKLSDISGSWAEIYISELVKDGIISGYPDGTFKPNNVTTRAEMVVIINKITDRPSDFVPNNTFTDVDNSFWAYKDIMSAANTVIKN